MKKLLILLLLCLPLTVRAQAAEFTAPGVPEAGAQYMPQEQDSFGSALHSMLQKVLQELRPNLREAARSALGVFAGVLAVSVLGPVQEKNNLGMRMVLTLAVSAALLGNAHAMIRLGTRTVEEMSDYGRLLLPVMAAALAAQGGLTASAALYTGTAVFDAVLSRLISALLCPMVYLFLALAVANSAIGEGMLKKLRDLLKTFISWCLKTILTVFTTYMSITGVVSGTTDAAALKATKVTISTMVPMVGSILSDASEAVLVSTGVMKNAAGIYGILAMLAIFLSPFLQIGVQYLVLKATAAVCGVFAPASAAELIEDFSTAMGMLLAMTGAACLLLLISTVCFMKGAQG